jgi:hypothetical protein
MPAHTHEVIKVALSDTDLPADEMEGQLTRLDMSANGLR